MTSPLKSPAAFHARAITETLQLPPMRHLVYRCARCGHKTIHFHQPCPCHPGALRHGEEVDAAEYARLAASAA